MSNSEIGDEEERDIDELVRRIIRDLDNPEPPIPLEQVRELLRLDLSYYSTLDPGFISSFGHRIKLAGKRIASRSGQIINALAKANLLGLWIPDEKKILIDENVPGPKQRFLETHEIIHSVIPWHQDFLLGDNETTLSPACHAQIEAEANYGAGRLLFLGQRFVNDARDLNLTWKSIKTLKKNYGNTLTTTLWHTIEQRYPEVPAIGLISRHPNHQHIGGGPDGSDCKHFVRSSGFRDQFPDIKADDIYKIVQGYSSFNSKGPVGDLSTVLINANGESVEFYFESFCNSYDLLTLGVVIT